VTIRRWRGPAADLHGRPLGELSHPVEPQVWLAEPDAPALVLGSRQDESLVDLDACARAGVEVTRRRSGGGIVLLVPGEVTWIDVVVPAASPHWVDDVPASMVRMGEHWADAIAATADAGLAARLRVHRGGLHRSAWSDLVCFAGIGPGEVLLDDAKLVGLSQRRTRAVARFQGAVHRRHDPERLAALLRGPLPAGAPPVATAVLDHDGAALATAIAAALTPGR
jgi:lipoate-protein ligase A